MKSEGSSMVGVDKRVRYEEKFVDEERGALFLFCRGCKIVRRTCR